MLFFLRDNTSTKDEALDLDVLDVIGKGFLYRGVNAQDVLSQLRAAPKAKTLRMRVNSVGGVVPEATSIYSVIRERAEAAGTKVLVSVIGLAASAATILTDAGDEVTIQPGAFFMIHNASSGTPGRGTADDHERAIDTLRKVDDDLVDRYVAASKRRGKNKTADEFRDAMKKERYFNASEAVAWGLADKIGGEDTRVAACADVEALRNAPQELFAQLELLEALQAKAVPYHAYPPKEDSKWDGAAAKDRIAKWASSDGSGTKEKIDWAKYEEAFAWFDAANAETFGAYKLPHHDVVDGKLVTSRAGTIAAGDAISGSRGGTSIPASDLPAVRSHLAKHYAQFGMKAPWETRAEQTTPPPVAAAKQHVTGRKERDMQITPEILALLGLTENATQQDLEAAIKAACETPQPLSKLTLNALGARTEIEGQQKAKELTTLGTSLLALSGASSIPGALAKVSEWKVGAENATALARKVTELETTVSDTKRDAKIEALTREGKLPPSLHAFARTQTAEQLDVFAAGMPAFHGKGPNEATEQIVTLTAEEKEICRHTGITEEKYLEQKKLDQARRAAQAGG